MHLSVFVMSTAMELAVECNNSYDRANDILTINCYTTVSGQTITGLEYTVNRGPIITGISLGIVY